MADDIRKNVNASRQQHTSRMQEAERAVDTFTATVDELIPECVEALRQLGIAPPVKLGFMKKGWKLRVPLDMRDENRGDRPIFVEKDGSWKWHTYQVTGSKFDARQQMIESFRYGSGPIGFPPASFVREVLKEQIEGMARVR